MIGHFKMTTEEEYQEASPGAWRTLALILLALAVYAAIVWSVHLYFDGRYEHATPGRQRFFWFVMDMTLYGFSIAALMFTQAVWLWNRGRKTVAAQRFPTPGALVARRVKIVHGKPAVRWGRLLQFGAVVLALSGCVGLALAIYALMSL